MYDENSYTYVFYIIGDYIKFVDIAFYIEKWRRIKENSLNIM